MDPDATGGAPIGLPTQPSGEILEAVASESEHDRLGIAIAIVLAIVAVTAAFAAWRTSVVSSQVSDTNRTALIDVSKQQAMHQIDANAAYTEASYGVDTAMKKAYGESLKSSQVPALQILGSTITNALVPTMSTLAGPFAAGAPLTPAGTYDVAKRIEELGNANPSYTALNPQAEFAEADRLAREKTWLTVLSVLFAIALFWLGMAEITAGRWRWVNLVTGIIIFVVTLGMFGAVELFFLSGGGAA